MEYDPIEAFIGIMKQNHDWEAEGVEIMPAWGVKAYDLRQTDVMVVGPVDEEDDFLGIGGLEFTRYVRLTVRVDTAKSRERAVQLVRLVRNILRRKENWLYDGRVLLNMRISGVFDLSDRQKGIYSFEIHVEWFTIEVRV